MAAWLVDRGNKIQKGGISSVIMKVAWIMGRNKGYGQEIDAVKNLADLQKREACAVGGDALELTGLVLISEEI